MKEKEVIQKQSKKTKETRVESNIETPLNLGTIDDLQIVDNKAYQQFKALSQSKWITDKRYYRSQHDRHLTIDLCCKRVKLELAIKPLPEQEQRYIRSLYIIITDAYYQLTMLKKKALGDMGLHKGFEGSSIAIDDLLLIEHRKADMMAMFARMYSCDEVHKICVQDWGIDITISAIELFRGRNLDKIIELQKEYQMSYSDIRLGYKKSRLEEYMWLYNNFKQKYEEFQRKEDADMMLKCLEAVKREVEGDLIRIEGDLQVNIEHTLNIHVQREVYKKLPINEMIITRVAAKVGVNPLLMLYRLQQSYYSSFSGFGKTLNSEDEMLPIYPSAQVYDLDKLNSLNANRLINEKDKTDTFENFMKIGDAEKVKAKTLSEIIKEKIKKRQEDLDKGIIDVDR